MTRPIDFTITVPSNSQFTSPIHSSDKSSSFYDKVNHFLSDPNDAPEYGFQDNAVTGIGFWLMLGARFSISIYKRGAAANSLFDRITLKAGALALALLTLPLTAVGASLKAIGSQFPHRVANLTIDSIPKTPAHKVDQVYELLQIADTLLRDNHINYSMDGGTFLGAIRHKRRPISISSSWQKILMERSDPNLIITNIYFQENISRGKNFKTCKIILL